MCDIQVHSNLFNSLPEICCSVRKFKEAQAQVLIEELGDLFIKHGAYKEFGLAMLHRHFELKPDEILVETHNDEETLSVAMPWNLNDCQPNDKKTWAQYGLPIRAHLVPQTWVYLETGELAPYEFLSCDEVLSAPTAPFVTELFSALKKFGLESLVGLRRIRMLTKKSSYETTPDDLRVSVTTFGEKPEGIDLAFMVKVVWFFTADRKLRNTSWCGICSHCNHCNTCQSCSH